MMKLYDDALLAKLESWTQGTQLQIYGVDETTRMFQVIADKQNDRPIQLPIIALTRRPGYVISNVNKQPMTYGAMRKQANDNAGMYLNSIPIVLSYQIDIYTRYLQECDSYCRDLVFNIINFPTFEITIPYEGINMKHIGTMVLDKNVSDNSSIPERLVTGQFYRMTINFTIDDARIWDVRCEKTKTIGDQAQLRVVSSPTDVVSEDIQL